MSWSSLLGCLFFSSTLVTVVRLYGLVNQITYTNVDKSFTDFSMQMDHRGQWWQNTFQEIDKELKGWIVEWCAVGWCQKVINWFLSQMCLESVCQYDNDNHYVCSQSWTVYVFNGSWFIYFVGAAKGPPVGRLCLRLAIDMLQFRHWRFMAKTTPTLQTQ